MKVRIRFSPWRAVGLLTIFTGALLWRGRMDDWWWAWAWGFLWGMLFEGLMSVGGEGRHADIAKRT